MRHTIFHSLAFTLLLAVAHAVLAQTQQETTVYTCAEYKHADARLNAIYRQILTKHKKDLQFIAKFKKAQRAWLKFRDAHLEAIFPAPNKQEEYGSNFSMCACSEMVMLANQRIAQLQQWLADNEGDVCAGSRF